MPPTFPKYLATAHWTTHPHVIWADAEERIRTSVTKRLEEHYDGEVPEECSVDVTTVPNVKAKTLSLLTAVHIPIAVDDDDDHSAVVGQAKAEFLKIFGEGVDLSNVTALPAEAPNKEARPQAATAAEPSPM